MGGKPRKKRWFTGWGCDTHFYGGTWIHSASWRKPACRTHYRKSLAASPVLCKGQEMNITRAPMTRKRIQEAADLLWLQVLKQIAEWDRAADTWKRGR